MSIPFLPPTTFPSYPPQAGWVSQAPAPVDRSAVPKLESCGQAALGLRETPESGVKTPFFKLPQSLAP